MLPWHIEKTVKKGDYIYALVPDHPNATENGYVLEHRVVVENGLGRLLKSDEVVHHINGDKKDNRLVNLEVMTNSRHSREHSSRQGRTWVDLVCPECGKVFSKPKNQSFLQKGTRYTCCSSKCRGRLSRKEQLGRVLVIDPMKYLKREYLRFL